MSTHITSDLEKIADEVICMDDGNIVFSMQKDAICNEAGIAHVRSDQLDPISEWASSAPTCMIKREFGADIRVPDRFAFSKAHPDIPIDSASIDEYMNMFLKGSSS